MRVVLALSGAVAATALAAAPAHARLDQVAPLDPLEASPNSCVVPAARLVEDPCDPVGAPERFEADACILPIVYLGGAPGPCPDRGAPHGSRIVPIGPADLSR